MFEFRAASATACTAVNGGATTISTSETSSTSLRNSLTNTTASWTVLYIFQFAARNGVRTFSTLRTTRLSVRQRRHARQLPAAEELERCAAARRDVGDSIGNPCFRHSRDRIAAADHADP